MTIHPDNTTITNTNTTLHPDAPLPASTTADSWWHGDAAPPF